MLSLVWTILFIVELAKIWMTCINGKLSTQWYILYFPFFTSLNVRNVYCIVSSLLKEVKIQLKNTHAKHIVSLPTKLIQLTAMQSVFFFIVHFVNIPIDNDVMDSIFVGDKMNTQAQSSSRVYTIYVSVSSFWLLGDP